jgi:hypothetical protein
MKSQAVLIKISRGLFAYQMYLVVRPLPTMQTLLAATRQHSEAKAGQVS